MASHRQIPGTAHPQQLSQAQMPQQWQIPSTLPPWRQPHPQPTHKPRSKRSGKVDSWRSYQADATNLQNAMSEQTPSTLNATAATFQPPLYAAGATAPSYRPYETLRLSNGNTERTTLATATALVQTVRDERDQLRQHRHTPQTTIPAVLPGDGFSSRYPIRSNRGCADLPLPSIEVCCESRAKGLGTGARHFYSTGRNTPRKTGSPRATQSPEAPAASSKYILNAQKEPVRITDAQKLLVILDLNGTLLYRTKRRPGNYKVHMRPGVTPFLDYLFDNHTVMVYTSTMPSNARSMVQQFLHPKHRNRLAALWGRDKLDLNQDQFRSKVQVYKKLDKVWQDEAIQKAAGPGRRWDQSNTVLIDDSKLKALAQPHNLLQVPEYLPQNDPAKVKDKMEYQHAFQIQQDIIKQLQLKLEELKYQANLSRLIRKWQTGEVEVPRVPGQEVVIEETVDQKQDQHEMGKEVGTHLPTPDSVGSEEASADEVDGGVSYASQVSSDGDRGKSEETVSSMGEDVFKELLSGSKKS